MPRSLAASDCPDGFDRRNADATERQFVTRLERLANKLTIETIA